MNNVYNDSIDDYWFNNNIIDCGITIVKKKLNNNNKGSIHIDNNNNEYNDNQYDSGNKKTRNTKDKYRPGYRSHESSVISNRKSFIKQTYSSNNILFQNIGIQKNDGKMHALPPSRTISECRYKNRNILLGTFAKPVIKY